MDLAFAAADVVISRAGAGTISELCIAAKAVIFVPSPNVAEDHQTHNARSLSDRGAALLVPDEYAGKELMKTAMTLIKEDSQIKELEIKIEEMALRNSAEIIAREIIKAASL
jgi:UDP-N-acetylglucosamine--N-acetylmuramyl-(pentapeptide) pyrophosphoryl-undecaprenol N-acetylglucosamine transferase